MYSQVVQTLHIKTKWLVLMLLVAVVVEVAETNILPVCRTRSNQCSIGCVYSYCNTMQTNHRVAEATNVVGCGSGGDEYSAEE